MSRYVEADGEELDKANEGWEVSQEVPRHAVGERELMHKVHSDSDWAGCKQSRRSRSGGIATLAGGIVKS